MLMLVVLFSAVSEVSCAQSEVAPQKPMNGFAVGFGGETNLNKGKTNSVLSANYIRIVPHLNRKLGIGVGGELTFAETQEYVLGLLSVVRLTEAYGVIISPAVLFTESESGDRKNLFVMRLGTKYTFELGQGFGLTPRMALAFVDGKTNFTYGINFGRDF